MAAKLHGWRERLRQWSLDVYGKPFEWGRTDCATLTASAVDVMCGTNFLREYEGRYHDRESALEFQRKHVGLRHVLSLQVGALAVPNGEFRLGDFVTAMTLIGIDGGHVVFGFGSISVPIGGTVCAGDTIELLRQPGALLHRLPDSEGD